MHASDPLLASARRFMVHVSTAHAAPRRDLARRAANVPLQLALLLLLATALLAGIVPASVVIDRRLARAVEARVREDLARAGAGPAGAGPSVGRRARMSPPDQTLPPVCEPARQPEDLGRFFVERANAADVDGLVALYEPDAVLALPGGAVAVGTQAIRAFYGRLLAGAPRVAPGPQSPALRNGDLALTSTRLGGRNATAEVARRQPDGTWLWAIDQPRVLG
ncbi:hypothetical protein tb265_19110 [Gemmatimonadetes bacterium T265]|nr:hypothetical protein tb265_19110 [Gemmatimonadetes bacterium T265]